MSWLYLLYNQLIVLRAQLVPQQAQRHVVQMLFKADTMGKKQLQDTRFICATSNTAGSASTQMQPKDFSESHFFLSLWHTHSQNRWGTYPSPQFILLISSVVLKTYRGHLQQTGPKPALNPMPIFIEFPKCCPERFYLAVPLCWQSYVIAVEELPVCAVKVWQDHLEESCSHESLLADRFRKKKMKSCVDWFPVSLFRPIPPWSPSLIWPAAAFLIHIRGIVAWVSISLL